MSGDVALAATTAVEPASAEVSDTSAELEAGEEGGEGEEVAAEPAKPTKAAAQKAKAVENRIKKLKLKVDGKEIEQDFNMDDEEALIRELQMSKMGQKRAQQHADLEKQVKAFFQAFEKDPFAAMTELGMKPDQAIDSYITKQMEQSKKSPEQLEVEAARAELQKMKAEREAENEAGKARELARLQDQAFTQYDTQMEQALGKSDLPKTPYTVKKIADYMLVALQAGKDVSPEDVIPLVREEMHGDIKELFASLPEDAVEGLLGEQMLNKLRLRRVAKAKAAQQTLGKGGTVQDTGKTSKTADKKSDSKVSYKDFFKI